MSDMIRVYEGDPVPYSDAQLRMDIAPARAPAGRLPDAFLAQFDCYRPSRVPSPSVTAGQIATENDLPSLVDGEWVYEWTIRDKTADELTADQVHLSAAIKAEAERRILAICPEWKQRNLIAQAAILAKKGEANWTQQEADAWDAGEAIWTQIAAIRAASDTLENDADSLTDIAGWEGWP